jgi:hypothetical protein
MTRFAVALPTICDTAKLKRSPSVALRSLKRKLCSSKYRNKWKGSTLT